MRLNARNARFLGIIDFFRTTSDMALSDSKIIFGLFVSCEFGECSKKGTEEGLLDRLISTKNFFAINLDNGGVTSVKTLSIEVLKGVLKEMSQKTKKEKEDEKKEGEKKGDEKKGEENGADKYPLDGKFVNLDFDPFQTLEDGEGGLGFSDHVRLF